jgi:DNA invertase Pin-like site-specific DNA recombinase
VKREGRKASLRCAIYTRVSTENGLEQEFNSLDNQREASEAYIRSQAHEGWKLIRDRYDDGGFSGGSMERPALAKLLDDVRARRVSNPIYVGRLRHKGQIHDGLHSAIIDLETWDRVQRRLAEQTQTRAGPPSQCRMLPRG